MSIDAVNAANITDKFALDVNGVNSLRLQSKTDPQAALKSAAQQFEAIFMQMMLKSMRDTVDQDGIFDSQQTKEFTSMLDQQLVQSLAGKGLGIADVMVRQLQPSSIGLPASATPGVAASVVAPMQKTAVNPTENPASAVRPNDFVNRLWPHAAAASKATGIAPGFMIGHAALESGWGKSEIRGPNGEPSHNLFGIKAGRGWKGAVVETLTTEYVNGVAQKSVEKFRAYPSYAEAFKDYANLLTRNPRYAAAVDNGNDPAKFAAGLQMAGYATDPMYADKLHRILQGNALRLGMMG